MRRRKLREQRDTARVEANLAEAEVRRLSIALDECALSARRDDEPLTQAYDEVDRLRSIIEQAAISLGVRDVALLERDNARQERDTRERQLNELRDAVQELRDLYAKDGTDAGIVATAAHEIRDQRRELRTLRSSSPAFQVPTPGTVMLLSLRDGSEKMLEIETVRPVGDYGFEITFKGEPLTTGYAARPEAAGSPAELGYHLNDDGWWRKDGHAPIREADRPEQARLIAAGWTLHYRTDTEPLWEHPEGGDDRYTYASAVALEARRQRDDKRPPDALGST